MPENKTARFPEGPEGAKLFDAWIKKQPQTVQDDWAANTEKYKDKFTASSSARVAADPHADAIDHVKELQLAWDKMPANKDTNKIGDVIDSLGTSIRRYTGPGTATAASSAVDRLAAVADKLRALAK